MDKYMRFLRNISKGDKIGVSSRAKRRLMDRELNKLNDGQKPSDGVDSKKGS